MYANDIEGLLPYKRGDYYISYNCGTQINCVLGVGRDREDDKNSMYRASTYGNNQEARKILLNPAHNWVCSKWIKREEPTEAYLPKDPKQMPEFFRIMDNDAGEDVIISWASHDHIMKMFGKHEYRVECIYEDAE